MGFATDAFGGTSGNNLTTGSWVQQTGFTENFIYGTNGAYANAASSAAYAVYQHTGAPAGADYSIFADISRTTSGTSSPEFGVCGRMQASAATFYAAWHLRASNETRLYKCVAGTFTHISGTAYSHTLTPGTPVQIELRMSGTSLSVYIDGVLRIGPVTDSSISTAGKAGIIGFAMRQAGVADTATIDNFDAVDAGGGSSTTLPPYMHPAMTGLKPAMGGNFQG